MWLGFSSCSSNYLQSIAGPSGRSCGILVYFCHQRQSFFPGHSLFISSCRTHSFIMLFSCVVIFFLGLLPFSLAQKDPLKQFCRIHGHQVAVVDDNFYVDGGMVNWSPLTADSINYTSISTQLDHTLAHMLTRLLRYLAKTWRLQGEQCRLPADGTSIEE